MANGMQALGELICRLNPYTGLPKDPTSGLATGEMQLEMINPGNVVGAAMVEAAAGKARGLIAQEPDDLTVTIAGFSIQVASNYGEKWVFKGQAHTVRTAVLIPYRFPIFKNGKPAYWQTENLLIGYAGSDGP
ncbi:MAG TPA: hypothetical protein VKI44_31555 [Acetobacteraceae bacterium]|nr:hypothetical protein [Acetobacteraceae bacterium]